MPRTAPRRRVPLAQAAEYSQLSVQTLRRYGRAGRITLYRVGPKLLHVDLNEIDQLIRPIASAAGK